MKKEKKKNRITNQIQLIFRVMDNSEEYWTLFSLSAYKKRWSLRDALYCVPCHMNHPDNRKLLNTCGA